MPLHKNDKSSDNLMAVFLDIIHLFFIFKTYVLDGLPLWYSGQSSWLQIQRSRFDFQRYQIF
jgi:hypothetical protein